MEDLNKISSTRVGDNIHFYVNGQEDKGTVVKMDTGYVTVIKDDGNFQDIHINDTFFIKDILLNKTWNDMNMEERTVKLHEIKAYSPRFLAKSWQELPRELKTVLEKSSVEQGHLGSAGRASHVVETNMDIDATEDYEGQTEDEKKEQFKHEEKKPKTIDKSIQEQLWEDWLNKETMSGGDSSPAQTSITTGTTGMYNAVYGKDGRIKGQEKDKDEEDTEKDKEEKEKERKG
jgi:PKD repeat protein